jgi:hypothetical protein
MNPLPADDLRTNLATWSVLPELAPAVASRMLKSLPVESYDPGFVGQILETTYFDSRQFELRKARKSGKHYVTLRVRHYTPTDAYAFSAKTEAGKFRIALPADEARNMIQSGFKPYMLKFLPADLMARIFELLQGDNVWPVATVRFRRYAVESNFYRLTLDIGIETDTGKCFPSEVLEQKAGDPDTEPFTVFDLLGLRPIKLSKFLWATRS